MLSHCSAVPSNVGYTFFPLNAQRNTETRIAFENNCSRQQSEISLTVFLLLPGNRSRTEFAFEHFQSEVPLFSGALGFCTLSSISLPSSIYKILLPLKIVFQHMTEQFSWLNSKLLSHSDNLVIYVVEVIFFALFKHLLIVNP